MNKPKAKYADQIALLRSSTDGVLLNAADTIEQLQAELARLRWIPVSEGPKAGKEYQICIKHLSDYGSFRRMIHTSKYMGDGYWFGFGIDKAITHFREIILPGEEGNDAG